MGCLSVSVGVCLSVSLFWKITDLDKWDQVQAEIKIWIVSAIILIKTETGQCKIISALLESM